MKNARTLLIPSLFFLGLPVTASPADAQSYTHDRGFFLRLAGGFGYSDLSANDSDASLHGASFASNVAVGGMVLSNFAVHGTFSLTHMFDPSYSLGGSSIDLDDTSVTTPGLGAGVTYYFMPINLYVSGSLLLAKANIDFGGAEADTDWGLILNTVVGKEWWVHPDWGMGVAGMLDLGSLPDDGSDEHATVVGFHILFTATYN